jgi:hypothetical protein
MVLCVFTNFKMGSINQCEDLKERCITNITNLMILPRKEFLEHRLDQ